MSSHILNLQPYTAEAMEYALLQQEAATSIQSLWRGYRVRSTMPTCPQNLETEYGSICRIPVNIHERIDFKDYLDPNESNPIDVLPHLRKVFTRGVIVSTGTERSFINLCLTRPYKCEGLVVRDINPRVKAYVDFVTLLLRISENCEEFRSLSEGIELTDLSCADSFFLQKDAGIFAERVAVIRKKLQHSSIPEDVKNYYNDHLEDFAKVYFFSDHRWKYADEKEDPFSSEAFSGVKYFKDKYLFQTLQKYAQTGNIIATLGDIGEIDTLQGRRVSVVDVSNIPDYTLIDLKENRGGAPLVIWTRYPSANTEYQSHIYKYINAQDRQQFTELLHILKQSGRITESKNLGLQIYELIQELRADDRIPQRPHIFPSYSPEILHYLQEYKRRYVRHIPSLGWVCFKGESISHLNALDEKGLEDFIAIPEIKTDQKIKDLICQNCRYLDRKTLDFFSNCRGFL